MTLYYQLSLRTRHKPPSRISFTYEEKELEHLNFIINKILKNVSLTKTQRRAYPVNILKILDVLIPSEYFGTTKHRKIFYYVVKRILTQSVHECVHRSAIVRGYDYELIPWLSTVKNQDRKTTVLKCHLFVLERVVKPLIAFYYKPVKTCKGHEIQLVQRPQWDSFESKAFNKLKMFNYLVPSENRDWKSSRGYLKIIPKPGKEVLDFRPIVSIFPEKNRNVLSTYKKITSKIYYAVKLNSKHLSCSLFDSWKSFVQQSGDRKIYGVKLDIQDAYGNVDLDLLCSIISTSRRTLSRTQKDFIIDHVKNQFVVFRKSVYEWKHGLLQGDRLSSCLCEIYMAYLDVKFVLPDLKDCQFFLHRTVDDYFFCSAEADVVHKFVKLIKCLHIVNESKTKSNILPRRDNEIPYCGKLFNLETKEVKNLFSFGTNYRVRHKFKVWNFRKQMPEHRGREVLERSMIFKFNNNSFTKLELNTIFNSRETVLENFFEAMVYVAYKFDVVVMTMRGSFLNVDDFLLPVLENVVRQYSCIACKKIKSYKGVHQQEVISCRLLKILSYKAFALVLKKRSKVYERVLGAIQNKNLYTGLDNFSYFNKLPKKFKNFRMNRVVFQ